MPRHLQTPPPPSTSLPPPTLRAPCSTCPDPTRALCPNRTRARRAQPTRWRAPHPRFPIVIPIVNAAAWPAHIHAHPPLPPPTALGPPFLHTLAHTPPRYSRRVPDAHTLHTRKRREEERRTREKREEERRTREKNNLSRYSCVLWAVVCGARVRGVRGTYVLHTHNCAALLLPLRVPLLLPLRVPLLLP